ncbi:ATP-dependent DNA helicase RecQ [Dethiosulfatibacter aminovorans DSM 17477]|uniref:DNA 3'-5' helicase n=1 Tax=Dethiosulfatibacter aminovorans DSM 17477 TaxID=1121476 RepID=A0A1M6LC58_9FIRM|nr:RecQ family ATP-dependent DNA helicase [Dethiosulfatibacter aminovorans]SHJ68759.1 ATP-dependent DNA helicase RecQ [Dethiosulfatibacter aminovorans DSM 17477]
MARIVFIDTEVNMDTGRVADYGAVDEYGAVVHTGIEDDFISFIGDADYICGHNILKHDLEYIGRSKARLKEKEAIDTLHLSPLLFPKNPYHKLVKDDKLQTEDLNNPVNDSIKAKELFFDELNAYNNLSQNMKDIFNLLLKDSNEFKGFFKYANMNLKKPRLAFWKSDRKEKDILKLMEAELRGRICENVDLKELVETSPIELAYAIAVISSGDDISITPRWVVKSYPQVERVITILRSKPCSLGCSYCRSKLDPTQGLRDYFGYENFRSFDGKELQKEAASAAMKGKSLLAIFPTGGGKSITFQVPALMAGKASGGLTVIISPLQSLMKDQVDNLETKGITCAVTINGLLDPIERSEVIRRVENGEAKLLYISPESLRSKSMERLLLSRKIERFVIDEAHCFSAWGQDFRVDYLYIGEFINKLCQAKGLREMIPVSCFTATAKQGVVDDIFAYFKDYTGAEMEFFSASISRKNLSYKVIECKKADKYDRLRLLIEEKQKPTIVYASKTKLTVEIADRLKSDGYNAAAYHGKMEKQIKNKNQEDFIEGNIDIMVATSAFGMGVDKSDVGLVIHYQISNSLENYVQEAGRAGRDQTINAECFILYDDNDLNEHFNMLNQTKLSINEIGQVWKAIKDVTRSRKNITQSALEIARRAGWDDNIYDLETRVKTAVTALEQAGYIKRGQNSPRVYADSILTKSVMDAQAIIRASKNIAEEDKDLAVAMVAMLIKGKSRKTEDNETRVDYISDRLGIDIKRTIRIIMSLREERILADVKDLSAFLNDESSQQKSANLLKWSGELEGFLIDNISQDGVYNIKALNEKADKEGLKKVTTDKVITLLNFWAIKGWIKKETSRGDKNHIRVAFKKDHDNLEKIYRNRMSVSDFILNYLYNKNSSDDKAFAVEFSVNELKEEYNYANQLFGKQVSLKDVEEALFYLSRIGALKIEGGFLVIYNRINIQRLELDNRIKYKIDDYVTLDTYYKQKGHQIHIVGEYAKKMLNNYLGALKFVDDYFHLQYKSFLKKYFGGDKRDMIDKNITPKKFEDLFGALSVAQLSIIRDNESKYIVVAAGPGSGKTRILVHKLASLLLLEDVKHEQLLMLTFSRASAIEFKKRLKDLIGGPANYIDIKTFHSYCFDLQGKVGDIDRSGSIVAETGQMIMKGEIEKSRITKTVMVVDEAQDMDKNEFEFIRAMVKQNDNMRIIAVGDDDQNIYAFRGSSSQYMKRILNASDAKMYELVENYRSKPNLIKLSNGFASTIENRMKSMPILPVRKDDGEITSCFYNHSDHMIGNVADSILKKDWSGNTCILTNTNFEALQVTGLLTEMKVKARLIQSYDNIKPINLNEIRYFLSKLHMDEDLHIIDKTQWLNAKKSLFSKFAASDNLDTIRRMISDFEETSGKVMYISDLMIHFRESKLEDFVGTSDQACYVSTIHKAKGREFDNVLIMLDRFDANSEEQKRALYVAMTRAKNNLEIHYKDNELHNIIDLMGQGVHHLSPSKTDDNLSKLYLPLSYKDVFLSYSYEKKVSGLLENLVGGDQLIVDMNGCYDREKNQVLIFSRKFKNELQSYLNKGYAFSTARVRHVVFWKSEDAEYDTRVLLPIIELTKK